jgi:hypothetical protein
MVASGIFQALATCKVGKLSFVAGAEIPKGRLPGGSGKAARGPE